MYCTSTKIVVIGTNIQRKAGPRVGSVGYVSGISKGATYSELPNCVVFVANILFTRYGYENKRRLEDKRVLLVVPHIIGKVNYKKALNRCIASVTKHNKRNTVLVVSPAKQDLSNDTEFCAKVTSCISSEEFAIVLGLLFNPLGYGKATGYHNLDNLVSILSENLKKFIFDVQKLRKKHDLYYLIHKYFYNNPTELNKLLTFVNRCEVLSFRAGKRRFGDTSGGPYAFYDALFNIQLFNTLLSKQNYFQGEIIKKQFKSLAKEIVVKGDIILQKHK